MLRGLSSENTPSSRSRALLVSVTRCDHRLVLLPGISSLLICWEFAPLLTAGIPAPNLHQTLCHPIGVYQNSARGTMHPLAGIGPACRENQRLGLPAGGSFQDNITCS